MHSISACIYVQDGGVPLKETLESISGQIQEQIVVAPAGNALAVETAHAFSAQMFEYTDTETPCVVLKNAFSKATGHYLLWLQEGDTFSATDRLKLRTLRHTLHKEIDAVRVKHAFTVGDPDTVAHYQYEIRMVAQNAPYRLQDDANPELLADGPIATYDLTITHRQDAPENFSNGLYYYQTKEKSGQELTPRDRLFYARALRDGGDGEQAIFQYNALIQGDAPKALRIAACLEVAVCQPEPEKRMDCLLQSFRFGPPQADICCFIGAYLQEKEALYEATFWYELALSQRPPISRRPIYQDYWGYIPALELCRCYYALGDPAKAADYNQIAGEYKPDDPVVRYNERFFADSKRKKWR